MKKPAARRALIVGNWKMHGTRAFTTELIDGIKGAFSARPLPPASALAEPAFKIL